MGCQKAVQILDTDICLDICLGCSSQLEKTFGLLCYIKQKRHFLFFFPLNLITLSGMRE